MHVRSGFRRLDPGRVAVLLVMTVGLLAVVTRDQWSWVFASGEAQEQGVDAQTVDVASLDEQREWLFRIEPGNGSAARYRVEERLAGSSKITVGTSTVIGGDIVIDTVDPAASVVGEVVVNVEMFTSDSSLRDKRLRHDFLESTHWPFARFVTTQIEGMPATFVAGERAAVTLQGDLTIKETTLAVEFAGEVQVDEQQLTATMTTTVLGSAFGVGPINIARLAHTSDEIVLEFDLVAQRVTGELTAGSLDTELPAFEFAGGAFAEHVQPLLEQRCVGCHTSGGPGWSTLAMDTAADVAVIAKDIALVTGAGYMPPWLPSKDSPAFHNDWSLSAEELQLIADWAATGGGLDVAPDTPLVASRKLVNPIREDLVLLPAQAYVGSVDRPDDYRCQMLPIPDPEGDGTWITGFTFVPDQTSIVHHSIVTLVQAELVQEAQSRDGADGKPGWTCYGGNGLSGSMGQLAGWAPGQQPSHFPDGYGIWAPPGSFVVNQVHYHYDHETPADRSSVILQEATAEQAAAGLKRVSSQNYLTPAELPCTPEEEATGAPLCDRDAVLAEVGEKYGRGASSIPDALLVACDGELADYAKLDGTTSHSSCDRLVGQSGTIYSVLGHMHEFGASYRMTLNPDTADERILLDIPVWSFEWQLSYEPVEEIKVTQSDIVRIECWWDRTLQAMPEPRYVTWNEGTVDEMCFSTIRVLPDR